MNLTQQQISDLIDAVILAKDHTPMFTPAWAKLDESHQLLNDLWLAL